MFGAHGLFAQPLDSLLNEIPLRNPGLKGKYQKYEALMERPAQARQWPEPELGLTFIAFPLPNTSPLPNASLGVMQPLPWKGERAKKANAALAEARAAYEEAGIDLLDLRASLKTAYWKLYELEASASALEENLELLRSLERLATARLEVGSATLTNVLEVQLRILELEQQQKQLRNARRAPQAQINQILNRQPGQPVILKVVPAMAETPRRLDSLARQIRQTYPGFAALDYEKEASRQRQAVNRIDRKPGLAIGLDYAVMSKGEGIHAGDGKDMWMPRLGLRLPLFREPYDAKEREESLLQSSLSYEGDELANALAATVEQSLARLEDARLQFELASRQKPVLETAIRVMETAFSTDKSALPELLAYYEKWVALTLMEIQAVTSSQQSLAEIERWLRE
ncbi:MAG: TolC family protein [Haliscomenobacter sp.]|nr:TolC family protein [Haliscomenobacter sp.]